MAGVATDGPLSRLKDYVQGPRFVPQGITLLHKGEAPGSVLFVARGLLSLWNEGLGHDQDTGLSISRKWSGTQSSADHRGMLSKGTSRLLRIGPGWVLGAATPSGSTLRPTLAPLTCLAETEVEVFELAKEDVHRLHSEDPALMLCLLELLMHFSAVVVRHMAGQLSDWHSLVYSG